VNRGRDRSLDLDLGQSFHRVHRFLAWGRGADRAIENLGRQDDQQRRGRDQLRHVRVRPAAPCLRPLNSTGRPSSPQARKGESLKAINGKTYDLTPEMLVIADASKPVGLAGVMGGLETEIALRPPMS